MIWIAVVIVLYVVLIRTKKKDDEYSFSKDKSKIIRGWENGITSKT